MHAHEAADSAAPVHNEIARLVFLVLVAVAAFFLTRAIAASNRDLTMRNAAEWYRRGEASVRAGDYRLGISDRVKVKVDEWPDLRP